MSRTGTGLLLLALLATARAADPATTLWFDQPAANFHQALPLGNGRLGAMVFGGLDEERIVLNESSVWSGSREEADRPAAHEALPEIRRLLLEGHNIEAEALVNKNFTCQGQGSGHGRGAHVPFGCYQTLGNLRLKFGKVSEIALEGVTTKSKGLPGASDYTRTLDLATGLATVAYTRNGTRFERTHYISAPDQVFVTHLKADQPGALSFSVTLERKERFETSAPNNHELLMTGTLDDGRGGNGVSYAARVRVVAHGGEIKREQDKLIIEQADDVYLFVTAATDFRGFAGRQVADPVAATLQDLEGALHKTPDALRAAQQADHRQFFDRMKLQLPATANSGRPTPARLIGFAQGAPDPALATLYFNFGRYLLISSSRPGGLPANLQGLWAEDIQTPWNGDWHLDINVQMNYWPAQVCNLSDLQEPLNKLIASRLR